MANITETPATHGGMEYKTFQFKITESKELNLDGDNYGVIKGYASVFGNIDRGGDLIKRGAFSRTIKEYQEKKRQVKLFYNHRIEDTPIGGILSDNLTEDDHGLYITAQINKKTSLGKDCYELAKQGVLCDFSFGYQVKDFSNENNIRILKDLTLWEVSLVGEPMNPEAKVTEVKAFNSSNIEDFKNNSELLKKLSDLFKLDQNNLKESLFKRYIEDVLIKSGLFTKQAAVYLASQYAEWGEPAPVIEKQGEPEDVSQKIPSESIQIANLKEIEILTKELASYVGLKK